MLKYMASVKAIANKILSTGGYYLDVDAVSVWKTPWEDAVTKGRMPLNQEDSLLCYKIVEAHNLIDYNKKFLRKIENIPYTKTHNNFRPRDPPYVFAYPFWQETQKEWIIPEHKQQVKGIIFTRTKTIPSEIIQIPTYRLVTLPQILSKASKQTAWCAEINLPVLHGTKAQASGAFEERDHRIRLTIFGNESLIVDISNLEYPALISLYKELFSHWYDYETPTGKGTLTSVIITKQVLDINYKKIFKEIQHSLPEGIQLRES